MSTIRLFLIYLCLLSISSCSQMTKNPEIITQFPPLNLEAFFSGKLTAKGMLKGRNGEVTRTFIAKIDATVEDSTITLKENFVFNDGEEQQRTWTLVKQSQNTYLATANDVEGNHNAKIIGNTLLMNYPLSIPYKNKPLTLSVHDKMYLVDKNTLLNESNMYKFGIRVASILLVIQKHPNND